MPNDGELRTETITYTKEQLVRVCEKYEEILNNKGLKMADLLNKMIAGGETAVGVISLLAGAPIVLPAVSVGTATSLTLSMLKSRLNLEYQIFKDASLAAGKKGHKYIVFEKQFRYKVYWMHGERWDAWFEDRIIPRGSHN